MYVFRLHNTATNHNKKAQSNSRAVLPLEPKAGLEPATYSLRMNCSTN